MYKCKDCGHTFRDPKFFEDENGVCNAICPKCNSCEFIKFDTQIEKPEVLLTLLQIIRHANSFSENLKDIYDDLDEIYGLTEELIKEMYGEFVTQQIANAVRQISSENDVQKLYIQLCW